MTTAHAICVVGYAVLTIGYLMILVLSFAAKP